MRVDQWPSSAGASFNTADVLLSSSNGGTSLLLRQRVPTDAGFTYPTLSLTKNPTLGQWVHVEFMWTTTPSTVLVTFDGQIVLGPVPLDSRIAFGIPYIEMGETHSSSSNDRTSFVIDNIVFDFQ